MGAQRNVVVELARAETQAGPRGREDRAAALIGELRDKLSTLRARADDDPYINPIKLLALDLLRRMQAEEIDAPTVEAVIQRLTLEAFCSRASTMRAYLGELDAGGNAASISALLRAQARAADGQLRPFAEFASALHRIAYGLVITAHPTFSLSVDLQEILASLAIGADGEGQPLDAEARIALLAEAERLPHRPPVRLDLAEEHAQSLRVLHRIRAAMCQVYEIAFDVALELYPDAWRELRPRLISVASWVGYDTDGRADIDWSTTFSKRLAVQLDQLAYYRDRVASLRGKAR
jgi:phosphoenolpyruvate carboxylase